jgi:tRNA/tmRNA/rRNA uracil-C5-methylase (TrmA/RlmC/RlmD family)
MSLFAKEKEIEILKKFDEQKTELNRILVQDPSLTKQLDAFKEIISDMSKDLKNRKSELGIEQAGVNQLKERKEKLERGEMLEPILDSEELHRTKVKQLMDLEEALRVDKKKMMLLVGSSLILMILQVGTFVFL